MIPCLRKPKAAASFAAVLHQEQEVKSPQITSIKDSYPAEMASVMSSNGQMRPAMVHQTMITFDPIPADPKPSDAPQTTVVTVQRVAPVPPPAHLPPPFDVYINYRNSVNRFLCDPNPCPAKTVERKRDESDLEYLKRVKCELYSIPKVMEPISKLLPPVLRHPKRYFLLLADRSEKHMSDIKRMADWFRAPGWDGFFSLIPRENMCDFRYHWGVGPSVHSTLLEAHRRALACEKGVASATAYLFKIVQRTSSFGSVPPMYQSEALDLLKSGAGMYGSGPDFWKRPIEEAALPNLRPGESTRVSELVKLLSSSRLEAFTARYPVGTVLCWGIPLLALIFEKRDVLAKMEVEANAAEFKTSMIAETETRKTVYMRCMEPLLVYGGNLSKLLHIAEDVCLAFRELGTTFGISFPSDIKQVSITSDGYMLGINGQRLSAGQFDPLAPKGLIPFPSACCDIKPLSSDAIWALVRAQYDREDDRIKSMIEECGFQDEESATVVAMMRRAEDRIIKIMKQDSHVLRLTHILPPTSSMPDAVYSPEELFGPPVDFKAEA